MVYNLKYGYVLYTICTMNILRTHKKIYIYIFVVRGRRKVWEKYKHADISFYP